LLQSATEHYEDTAKGILDTLGIKTEGSISKPTEAVPVQAAGEARHGEDPGGVQDC